MIQDSDYRFKQSSKLKFGERKYKPGFNSESGKAMQQDSPGGVKISGET